MSKTVFAKFVKHFSPPPMLSDPAKKPIFLFKWLCRGRRFDESFPCGVPTKLLGHMVNPGSRKKASAARKREIPPSENAKRSFSVRAILLVFLVSDPVGRDLPELSRGAVPSRLPSALFGSVYPRVCRGALRYQISFLHGENR